MQNKQCTCCSQSLPISNFRKSKKGKYGVAGRCKICQSFFDSKYRETEARAISLQKYNSSEKHIQSARKWRDNNITKRRAHERINNAIRDGKITPLPCLVCGTKAHAHHVDYNKPLDVVWVCPIHHKQMHKQGGSVYASL